MFTVKANVIYYSPKQHLITTARPNLSSPSYSLATDLDYFQNLSHHAAINFNLASLVFLSGLCPVQLSRQGPVIQETTPHGSLHQEVHLPGMEARMTYEPAHFIDQSVVPALCQGFMQVSAEFYLSFEVDNSGPDVRERVCHQEPPEQLQHLATVMAIDDLGCLIARLGTVTGVLEWTADTRGVVVVVKGFVDVCLAHNRSRAAHLLVAQDRSPQKHVPVILNVP